MLLMGKEMLAVLYKMYKEGGHYNIENFKMNRKLFLWRT